MSDEELRRLAIENDVIGELKKQFGALAWLDNPDAGWDCHIEAPGILGAYNDNGSFSLALLDESVLDSLPSTLRS